MARKRKIVEPEKVKSRSITAAERRDALARLEEGVELSPVLSQLGVTISTQGRHFLFQFQSDGELIDMARVTPIANSPAFALEYMAPVGWALFGQGTPTRVVKLLCNDTLGTYHGLGSIDQTLRNLNGESPEITRSGPRAFTYSKTGYSCTLQEALYFYFDLPLEVIMEPREWYQRHASPSLLETGLNDRRILVRFCDRSEGGSKILGHALYALKRDTWWALTLPEEEGQTLQSAEPYVQLCAN